MLSSRDEGSFNFIYILHIFIHPWFKSLVGNAFVCHDVYFLFSCPVNIAYICVINNIKHTLNFAKSWNGMEDLEQRWLEKRESREDCCNSPHGSGWNSAVGHNWNKTWVTVVSSVTKVRKSIWHYGSSLKQTKTIAYVTVQQGEKLKDGSRDCGSGEPTYTRP